LKKEGAGGTNWRTSIVVRRWRIAALLKRSTRNPQRTKQPNNNTTGSGWEQWKTVITGRELQREANGRQQTGVVLHKVRWQQL